MASQSSSHTSLATMDREMCSLLVELASDKVTVRQKSFQRMGAILQNREEAFLSYMASDSFDTQWDTVLDAAFQGIEKQSYGNSAHVQSKNHDYVVVLTKLVELAMGRDTAHLAHSQVVRYFVRAINDQAMRDSFGICFLQMLKDFVLGSKWSLTSVSYQQWKEILDGCFVMLDSYPMHKQVALNSISLAVEKFLSNCSRHTLLADYLERLNGLLCVTVDKNKSIILCDLIKTALNITQAIAVDCKTKVIKFLESIHPCMVKIYETANLRNEQKAALFRLMHLSLIILYPGGKSHTQTKPLTRDSVPQLAEDDETRRRKMLRVYHYIMVGEMNARAQTSSSKGPQTTVPLVDGFIDFAARLCYTVYWNEDHSKAGSHDEAHAAKRNKEFNKLQSIIEMVGTAPNHYNLRWLLILAAVLDRYEPALATEDYLPLLRLLCNVQPNLQSPVEHDAFYQCCSVLLKFEQKPSHHHRSSDGESICSELWSKMIAAAFRACTNTGGRICTTNASSLLLQLLIRHLKYPDVAFLNNTVLEAFYTYAVKKTNLNVGTILAILETVGGIEQLGAVNGIIGKLFNYLYPQTRETAYKEILHANERLTAETLAQISVLCVVTTRPTTSTSTDKDDQHSVGMRQCTFYLERDRQMKTLEQRLRRHNLEELLALDYGKDVGSQGAGSPQMSYNINEPLFKRLLDIISFDNHILPEGNDFLVDAVVRLCEDLELYLQITNILLLHGAYNERQYNKLPLYKKVRVKFELLNAGFERLQQNDSSLTLVETKRLSERLLALFRGPYHTVVKQMIPDTEHASIMRWVIGRISLTEGEDSSYVKVLQPHELSSAEEQLQRCFYNIVAEYLQYPSAPCMAAVHELLESMELNVHSSTDLFYIFDMCRIMLGQPSQEVVAQWVMRNLVAVCKAHYTNPDITEQLIDMYGALTLFIGPYEDQTRNITILLHSFVKQCAKHTYSTDLQLKIYGQVRYLLRAYPQHVQQHEKIYNGLVPLLNSSSYPIQLEAVVNILHCMKLDWSHTDLTLVPCSFYEFQLKLYELIQFNELTDAEGMDVDEKTNAISCCLQLLLGIFRVNFMLRRRALADFVLLIQSGNVNAEKLADITRLARGSTGIDFSKLLQANLDVVLELWLTRGYRLLDFPYRLAGKIGTIDEFVQLFKQNISFIILCMQPERFEQFCESISVQKGEMLKAMLPKCISFLLPMYAKCEGLSAKYMAMANRMNKALDPYLKTVDLKDYRIVSDIIKHLTLRVNDHEELGKLLDQELPSCFVSDLSVSKATYSIAIEHLKQSVWASVSFKYRLLSNLCLKNASPIERTLSEVKRSLWAAEEPEQKMVHLLQYTVLLDHLEEYLAQQKERSFKPYLVRDVVYFMCNLLASVPALQFATLNGFGRFLENVVTAGDACELLAEHLQFIVSSLLEVENVDPTSKISQKALSLLQFLILQHAAAFGDAIGKLNYLPKDQRFDQLRLAISHQKTSGHELMEEIEALLELPNLRYEDLAALNILLTTKKKDLKLLCDELGEQSVSSTVNRENVLHRLVYTLLEVVRSSPFDKRSTEALRCLGEIGPIDLGTMLLKSDAEMIAYDTINNSKEAVERCADYLLNELDKLLTSRNITVGNLASQICYKMLYGKTFHTLAAKHPTFYPFLVASAEETKLFTLSAGRRLSLRETLTNERVNYHTFVQQLSAALLLFLGNTMLKKLVEHETLFAEKIIPLLVQIAIKQFDDSIVEGIGCFINEFFSKFVATPNADSNIFNDPKAIQLMLTVVECVRIHNQLFPQFKIAVNYLPIAQASQFCQAHFKAILYGELWYREEQEQQGNDDAKLHPILLSVMKGSHLAIGVEDAVKSFLNPIQEGMEYYRLEQKHDLCLVMQDASATWQQASLRTVPSDEILQTLNDLSLYGLARSLQTTAPIAIDYECAWRLSDWDVVVDTVVGPSKESGTTGKNGLLLQSRAFERAHYRALKCLKLRDEHAAENAITEARRTISELFKLTSIESTKHIYQGLCRLRMLQQIEDFGEIHFAKHIDCEQELLTKWAEQDELSHSEFAHLETILSQRLALLSTAGNRENQQWVASSVNNTLLLLIHESRLRGFVNCALRNVVLIGKEEPTANVHSVVMLENAQLNWSSGQREVARALAREVMDSGSYNNAMVKGVACRLYGEFLAEENMQEMRSLWTDYFKQSEKCVQFVMSRQQQGAAGGGGGGEQSTSSVPVNHRCFEQDRNYIVHHTIAKYADREFVRLTKHVRSQEWEARKQNLARMEQELVRLKQETQSATDQRRKDLARSLHFMQKNWQRDRKAAEEIEQNRSEYLNLALRYYLKYAQQSTIVSDMVIFRITSLWLNNLDNGSAMDLLEKSLLAIPSYKFIAVLPQLTPRVGLDRGVGKLVQQVLIRCALDHPHHTLPFVFAQLHAFKDQPDHETPTNDNRLMGVREVYNKLRNEPALERMLQQTERMNLALIELANKTLSSNPSFREYTMTKRDPLARLENLDLLHCPTVELPVLTAGHYPSRIVGIQRWDAKVIGVGGINAPKKLTCLCLDGKKRTQLLKGKDDMRQDAVMQQVFGIMNILLRHDKETAHRKLSVRTYKVVPLSKQSGILEWCNNTVPIGAWLLTGHPMYRPQDMEPTVARKKFANNALAGMTLEKKQKNYEEICNKIRPVFRHYFLEQYLKPGVWFDRQQNYTKSVAASSMIGYVLGIGDRHVQNILIDKLSGEVIHIDFGIAFEMGKNLPTPETIPFRLTRDIVDGMGVSGVEGVFRKSCEKTLEVLRNNHTVILAILEVLLYDPLYSWNVLSNKKAKRQQLLDDGEEEDGAGAVAAAAAGLLSMENINVTAERTLMQVKEKLLGKEENRYISVEGQVQTLIYNAMSKRNLCQVFAGWQPYL